MWRQEAGFSGLARAGHATCAWGDQLLLLGGRTGGIMFAGEPGR